MNQVDNTRSDEHHPNSFPWGLVLKVLMIAGAITALFLLHKETLSKAQAPRLIERLIYSSAAGQFGDDSYTDPEQYLLEENTFADGHTELTVTYISTKVRSGRSSIVAQDKNGDGKWDSIDSCQRHTIESRSSCRPVDLRVRNAYQYDEDDMDRRIINDGLKYRDRRHLVLRETDTNRW